MATTFTVCRCDTAYVAGETGGQNKMVNKIRRVKITVHTREMMVTQHGTDHTTQDTEIDLAVCPVCHTPMKSLPSADQRPAIDIKALENKTDK